MSAAVIFSSIVALTLTPMMCSKLLKPAGNDSWLVRKVDAGMSYVSDKYRQLLTKAMCHPVIVTSLIVVALGSSMVLFTLVPQEFAPREDRGSMFLIVNGPQGASFEYIESYMDEIETRLMPLVDSGDIKRLLIRAPRSFGRSADFSNGMAIIVLEDWAVRRSAAEITTDIRERLADLAGIRAFPVMRQAFGRGVGKPVQFVLGGPSYEESARWRDIMLEKAKDNPNLVGLDHDYQETKPQLRVIIDKDRAADLGVSIFSECHL
ncbi:AcrB/AcrD/AcrF family protein [Shewanella benthica KT99]|uniref:AcrB/AcrD/AcrF family protein n=1 Tax=Shewanella benthica KT99 TaxID=314608 RepID=A9DI25_9GAMM|nr:AcrB/AcrD/AcrF family protein [Shewanella benthica KT99]